MYSKCLGIVDPCGPEKTASPFRACDFQPCPESQLRIRSRARWEMPCQKPMGNSGHCNEITKKKQYLGNLGLKPWKFGQILQILSLEKYLQSELCCVMMKTLISSGGRWGRGQLLLGDTIPNSVHLSHPLVNLISQSLSIQTIFSGISSWSIFIFPL